MATQAAMDTRILRRITKKMLQLDRIEEPRKE
jgi:hypothetical protein